MSTNVLACVRRSQIRSWPIWLAVIVGLVNIELTSNDTIASPWPTAGRAPAKAPPAKYPNKPTGWTVRQNDGSQPVELEWRDSTGMFAIVSREYQIPFDHQFLASSSFEKLPMEIGNRLLEPALFYRAYLIKDNKYFELPTPLGYTFTEAEGYVEMWYKGDKLDMLDGIPAQGGKYHKKADFYLSQSPLRKGANGNTKAGKGKRQ